jgi:hypothetical protein
MAKKQQYIDNKLFLQALIDYRKVCREAKKKDKPIPPVPDYIGECFLKIGTHLSYKPNFINYTFREDMVGDGIENCLRYVRNFNPSKSKNPFAYFTQIMYFAFLRRIQGENKQLYIKYKSIQNSSDFDESAKQAHDEGSYDNTYVKFLQRHMGQVITDFETRKANKGKPRSKKPRGVELFFNWGDDVSCGDPECDDEDVSMTVKSLCG